MRIPSIFKETDVTPAGLEVARSKCFALDEMSKSGRTDVRNPRHMPARSEVGDDTPLRLAVAAVLAYPDGSMTASGLRREAARGRLVIERTAGKDYTTLAAIEKMRALCRVQGKVSRPWLGPEKRNPEGTLRERAVRVIRDGPSKISTGCPPEDRAGAERALGEQYADKYKPNRARGRHPSEILIADDLCLHHLRTGHQDAPRVDP